MDREFLSAASVEEAVKMAGKDTAFFAGGTEIEHLNSKVTASTYILLKNIQGLAEIKASAGEVKIGALVTFTKALKDPEIPAYLKEALHYCGSLQKRNMATLAGNIAACRCDSYLIPTLLAADAQLEIADEEGLKTVSLQEYVQGRGAHRKAADADKEAPCCCCGKKQLITAIIVPKETDGFRIISKRYANTVESHAYLTIAMGRKDDAYRIGLGIKGSGIFTPDITNWSVAWKQAEVKDDMFGSEEYKRYLTGTTLDDMYEKLSGEGGDQV